MRQLAEQNITQMGDTGLSAKWVNFVGVFAKISKRFTENRCFVHN